MGVQVRLPATGAVLDLDPDLSFALEMENPMLDDSGMPTAYSTQISFLPTPTNLRAFGYFDMLMMDPQVKTLAAELWICGVMMFSGTLVYDSIEDGKLNYTFSGKDIESEWSKKIWQRPILYKAVGEEAITTLFSDIWAGMYENQGVYAPVMVNKDMTASEDSGADLSVKYHNHVNLSSQGGYSLRKVMTPVFRISAILSDEFRLIMVDESLKDYVDVLVMVGLYKTDTDTWCNGWPSDEVEVETSLPDVTGYEVLQGILKMFCATMFVDGQHYRMLSAETVLSSAAELDWSMKMSDVWESSVEEAQGYRFSYGNSDDENTMAQADAEKVDTVGLLESLMSGTISLAKHISLGDVYSKSNGYFDMVWHELGNVEPENTENTFDNSVDFDLVRSVPDKLMLSVYEETEVHRTYYRMIPIVEPGDLGERGSKMYVGLMSQGQLSDKQIVFEKEPYYDSGGRWHFADFDSGMSLAPKDLYGKFHKSFKEWIAKDRQVIKADMNLSPVDIANFRMWRKVVLNGRQFIVKKLSFTFYANSDRIESSAEFLSL